MKTSILCARTEPILEILRRLDTSGTGALTEGGPSLDSSEPGGVWSRRVAKDFFNVNDWWSWSTAWCQRCHHSPSKCCWSTWETLLPTVYFHSIQGEAMKIVNLWFICTCGKDSACVSERVCISHAVPVIAQQANPATQICLTHSHSEQERGVASWFGQCSCLNHLEPPKTI